MNPLKLVVENLAERSSSEDSVVLFKRQFEMWKKFYQNNLKNLWHGGVVAGCGGGV